MPELSENCRLIRISLFTAACLFAAAAARPARAQTTVGGSTDSTYSTNVTSGSLTKIGSNTVTLTGSNSYGGGTFINAGILSISSGTNIGTGTISTSAATGLTVSASSAVSLTNDFSLGATGQTKLLKQSSGDLALAGVIGGGGTSATLFLSTSAGDSLTTFTLSGSNTFRGGIVLDRGSLVVNSLGALGDSANEVKLYSYVNTSVGNLRFAVSGTFANPINNFSAIYDDTIGTGTNDVVLTGNIYGGGGLTKYGSGRLTITGSNTYANGTTIAAGTLQVGNGGTTGSLGSGAVANSGELILNRSNTLTVSNAISGSGSLSHSGSGLVILTGNNTYTGNTTISSGTLQIGNGGTSGSLGSTATVTNNGTLAINRSDALTFARPIIGTGGVIKTGAGTLTLTGSNTYSGGTILNSGTLSVAGEANLGSGAVTFTAPAQLTVTGSSATFSNSFDLGSFNGRVDLLTPNNSLTTINGAITGGGADTVVWFNGGDGGQNTGVLRLNGTNAFAGTLRIERGPLILGNASAAGTAQIFLNSNLPAAGALQFADSFTIANGVTTSTQTDRIGVATGLTGGISGQIVGTAGIEKVGAGKLVLSADNTYAGATLVSTGTLQVGDGGATGTLGAGTVTTNATLSFSRSGLFTIANRIGGTGVVMQDGGTLLLTGTLANDGGIIVRSGSLRLGGNPSTDYFANNADAVIEGGTLDFANVSETLGQVTLKSGSLISGTMNSPIGFELQSGSVSATLGGSGSLLKTSAGTVILSAANTYAGTTTISAGELRIGNGGTAGTLGGAGTVTSNGTLSFDRSDAITFARVINGAGGFRQLGSGTTTLTASNNLPGGAELADGTLALGSAGALGASGTISFTGGTLQYSASNTADYSSRFSNAAAQQYRIDTNGQNVALSSALTSADGTFTKLGSGTLTLTGSNSYQGETTISAGTLKVGSGGSGGSLGTGAVTNNAALVFDRSNAITATNTISGNGSLTKLGAGDLTLSGSNSYSGGTTVSAGRLIGTTASLQGAIANGAAVEFAQDAAGSYTGIMSGTGTLTKTGAGRLELTGVNSLTGQTSVQAGELKINGSLASALVTTAAATTLSGTGSLGGDVTIEGLHSPGNSPGIQSIAGDLTYSGGSSSVLWELTANTADLASRGVSYDGIDVGGNLSFSAPTLLSLSFDGAGSTVNWNDAFWSTTLSGTSGWLLYDVAGTTTGLENLALSGTSWIDAFGNSFATVRPESTFALSQIGSDVYLTVVAVPEPSTIALVGIGACVLTAAKRRRRK